MADHQTSPVSINRPNTPANPLARFPAAIREAHQVFLASGDINALDTVVIAIVRDHQPSKARAATPDGLPDSAQLIGELGFDSLALAEIVFFIEDLYRVSITNDELTSISTVGELRAFIRTKIASLRAS